MKRTPRKPTPGMAEFWATVTENGTKPCEICGSSVWRGAVSPRAVVDAHHYIPKQRLPERAKADPRVGVPLCRGCHQQVEWKRIECPRPPELDAFLADHGLLESGRPDPKLRAA